MAEQLDGFGLREQRIIGTAANDLAQGVSDQLGDTESTPMIGEIRDAANGAPLALVVGRDDADFGN